MRSIDAFAMDYRGIVRDRTNQKKIERNMQETVEQGYAPLDLTAAPRASRAAIVGYGPSLAATWERLRDYDGPIVTVSKAHDFLVDKGITPTHHVDVDISPTKLYCIERPRPGVEYLMASKMVPEVIAALPKEQVRLFHVDIWGDVALDARYPRVRVWFDASTTAADIMYRRGYYYHDWFGIDYGMPGGKTYPGPHHGSPHDQLPVVFGKDDMAYTSELMVHGLVLGEHMLRTHPALDVTIHGDGLFGQFLARRRRTCVEVKP